jgi:CHAT domain-containing protein
MARVWDAVIRGRAMVVDEIAARHEAVRFAGSPDVSQRFKELRVARERYSRLAVQGGTLDAEEHRAEVEIAARERDRAEMALAEVSDSHRLYRTRESAGLQDVRNALQSGQALVAFVRFERSGFDEIPHDWGYADELLDPTYSAFVLADHDAAPKMLTLGTASEVESVVSSVRRQIETAAAAGSRAAVNVENSFRESAVELKRIVWDPIAPHVAAASEVLVVPDGVLHLIDLSVVPVSGERYLIENGPRFHYVGAERDIVGGGSPSSSRSVLAFGNPNFDESRQFGALGGADFLQVEEPPVRIASAEIFRGQRASCGSFQDMSFDPLPGSESEVAEVVEVLKQNRKAAALRGPSSVSADIQSVTGAEATERVFKELAPHNSILHVATHGFFLGGECATVSEGANEEMERFQTENPLVLSGLALAGANRRAYAGPTEEDGILTAEEISSLDLTGVDWAVLSACDTGLGEIAAGEGVLGLRRAFQIAGARTLIMSLWPVDDEVTRAWMRELYTNRFVEGMSTIDSVHEANLALLKERRDKGLSTHPFYWAGFIASGDWR